MILRIFRVVWFVSVLVLFANLIYGYAGWQENMILQEEAGAQILIGKDGLFYILTGIFVIFNVLVYPVGKIYPQQEDLRAWFHGLILTINIFFIVALSLIGLYNSAEKFDYSRIGGIIYGSVILVILWAAAWPVYTLFRKFLVKHAV